MEKTIPVSDAAHDEFMKLMDQDEANNKLFSLIHSNIKELARLKRVWWETNVSKEHYCQPMYYNIQTKCIEIVEKEGNAL